MRRLWREPVAEYSDEFYTLRPSLLYPKPVQKPRLPIHILGDSKAALRRVADFGDGFLPMDIEPESLADPLSILACRWLRSRQGQTLPGRWSGPGCHHGICSRPGSTGASH
jgi:alkanesulfonate monooxygenase SsuD/methylene tetrahydromethanopterin reductase-like flavin-dependent oxidoreductase (luciferase family)